METVGGPRAVRYIWFDQDDTLYSFQNTMRRALNACLPVIHQHFPQTKQTLGIAEMISVREDISARAERAGMDFIEARREAFRETLCRYAHRDEALEELLVSTYYATLRTKLWPFPDTVQCLRELAAAGHVLGVLSDGMSLLEELQVDGFFRHRIYAPELGLRKPDPALFEHAASTAGADPEQCALVGDNVICDVVGARDAGWTGIWLNREGETPKLSAADLPEHVITSLAELPPLVAGLRST